MYAAAMGNAITAVFCTVKLKFDYVISFINQKPIFIHQYQIYISFPIKFPIMELSLNIPDEIPSAVQRYENHFLTSLLCISDHNFYEDISKGCYTP